MEMAALPEVPGAEPGRVDWAGADTDPRLAGALRLWPHRFPGAGHFVAALRRSDGDTSATSGDDHLTPASRAQLASFHEFVGAALARDPGAGRIVARGDDLFLLPDGAPPLDGVRLLRPGWWLGSARTGRFDPSHALAMALGPADVARSASFPVDAPEVAAWLRGEALRVEGESGWVMVCVDGFPLGWGKRSGGVVKNHYPRGLRRP